MEFNELSFDVSTNPEPYISDNLIITEEHLEDIIEDLINKEIPLFKGFNLNMYSEQNKSGRQFRTPRGIIDILAVNKETGDFYVIELKKGYSVDSIIGQISRYMGWVKDHLATDGQNVFGIICLGDISDNLIYAAKTNPNIKLFQYIFQIRRIDTNKDTDVFFPDTFTYTLDDEDGNPRKLTMKLVTANTTIADVLKLNDSTNGLVFLAFHWEKKYLNDYLPQLDIPAPPKGFDFDLDVCAVSMVNNRQSHLIAMSIETEAMYNVRASELQLAKGATHRLCHETPFQIYVGEDYKKTSNV